MLAEDTQDMEEFENQGMEEVYYEDDENYEMEAAAEWYHEVLPHSVKNQKMKKYMPLTKRLERPWTGHAQLGTSTL